MADQYWGDEAWDGIGSIGTTAPYANLEPWSTSPEGTTGYSLKVDDGELFDGYQFSRNETSGFAAARLRGGAGDFACWSFVRGAKESEAEVRLVPSVEILAGVAGNDTFRQFGVCSHVSGFTTATPSSSLPERYHHDCSGYFLIETKNAAGQHRVLLLELASGSITVLGSENVQDSDSTHRASPVFAFHQARPLRLVVQEDGAGADIDCYRTDGRGQERALFGGTISRGTRLNDGWSGFGLQTVRTDSGGCQSVGVAHEFSIADPSTGAFRWVDRFERVQRRGARELTDGNVTGHSLASGWIGDQNSRATTAIHLAETLYYDAGVGEEASFGADDGATSVEWPGFHLRQHAPRTREQHYSADVTRLNSETSIRCEMGLLVRFTAQAFPTGNLDTRGRFPANGERAGYYKSGYAVYVVHDTSASPVWQMEVRHFNGSTSVSYRGDLLATADLTAFSLALGTAFNLDVEIRNFDGDSYGVGSFISIAVAVDSTDVTLVAESVSGVTIVDGELIDLRSAATQDVGGVGLYVIPDSLGTGTLVSVDNFTEEALTVPPLTAPSEQATVSVPAEVDGKSGSLTQALEARIDEERNGAASMFDTESGKQSTVNMQPGARRAWTVEATYEPAAWAAVMALFESNGTEVPFDWTHPYSGEALVVFFDVDEIEFREVRLIAGSVVYVASFTLVEAFALTVFNAEA